jgi:predicted helicase
MLAGRNICLILNRQIRLRDVDHFLVSSHIVDVHILETANASASVFPLYLYPAEGEMQFDGGHRRPNLNPEFIKAVSDRLGLKFIEDGRGDFEQTFGPEDIFNYAYAVFHSPTYRTRYAEFLKMDFPRLPLTSDKELFKALAAKGAELVSLHLMESPVLNNLITGYPITGSNALDKVTYDDNNQRVYINKEQYFEGVPPEVWDFHIGGYQVCQKWLKDRKGRTLTYDELAHYQKVIVALKETIRLMTEIDELIPGWPIE